MLSFDNHGADAEFRSRVGFLAASFTGHDWGAQGARGTFEPSARHFEEPGLLSRVARWFAALCSAGLERYLTWRDTRRSIAELASLDDRLLKDIGVSRAQVEALKSGALVLSDLRREHAARLPHNVHVLEPRQSNEESGRRLQEAA